MLSHTQIHAHTQTHTHLRTLLHALQAFINTAREIYRKIQDGVFDVSNEVRWILTQAL